MSEAWTDGERSLYLGDALEVLRELPDESIHMCVTSPPYWGLRSYSDVDGEQVQVWGGDDCKHEWGALERGKRKDILPEDQTTLSSRTGTDERQNGAATNGGRYCSSCDAWRGALGLEPTIDLFVEHLTTIFREVKRVLRPDGVCMVNVGDSYAAQPGQRKATDKAGPRQQTKRGSTDMPSRAVADLKPKDLIMQPFRVASALQADGWWLRSIMPWIKPSSAMPESCRDRPAVSHEYWIMLTKSARYYWDADAVRSPHTSLNRKPGNKSRMYYDAAPRPRSGQLMRPALEQSYHPAGRSRRTGDGFLESLDAMIAEKRAHLAHLEAVRKDGGLLVDYDGAPIATLQNPQPFKGAPFLGDWSHKEWRVIGEEEPDPDAEDDEDSKLKRRRVEVWYIASPDCTDHSHYHRTDKWAKLGYADGREVEARAGDADETAASCPCVEVKIDHFAAFGEKLVTPLLKAGCPVRTCAECGAPCEREVRRGNSEHHCRPGCGCGDGEKSGDQATQNWDDSWKGYGGFQSTGEVTGRWVSTCSCDAETQPGTVLDPFNGSGTTGVVAKLLGLRYVGVDVSRDYLVMSEARIDAAGKTKAMLTAERASQGTLELD